ncbi:MAG: FtsX-like permease family protein, partial [Acidobacteriaceae bacterium]|nr:FtsX-like permease family protein [Acidobacteriaceae bacterium]
SERYGLDAALVGSVFDLNGKPFTIIGITPPGFYGDSLRDTPPDFFVPLATGDPGPDNASGDPKLSWLQLIGRMRPGFKAEAIQAEMRIELKQWLRSHWADMDANERTLFPTQTLYLAPGGGGITGMRDEYDHWLSVLMIVSGFVLLIVCANVANLMVVRGLERRRQTAVSVALGARPFALVRQAFAESVLLSLFGGAVGLGIAFAGTSFILRFVFPRAGEMTGVPIEASPSVPVLLFTFALSFLTGIAFGIAPAWMAARVDPIEALR